ncbi:MAG: vitamin K epoxide reductase family protein [Cyanobacterium sp.]
MIRRRRNVPWIQKHSRLIIGAIALVGLILTSYLTVTSLAGGEVVCTGEAGGACDSVLDSAYAYPFDPVGRTGPPLSVLGMLGYLTMGVLSLAPLTVSPENNKKLRQKLETNSWLLILALSFAMATFSGYLMYVLAFELQTACYYCIGSALFSLSFLVMAFVGHDWDDIGQILFIGAIVVLVTIVGAIGVYANVNAPTANNDIAVAPGEQIPIPRPTTAPQAPIGWEITTTSGPAEIELAQHLASVGATKYTAYWCPHCYDQKQLFGEEAYNIVPHIECTPDGLNGEPEKCEGVVRAFPSWVIDGQLIEGTQTLERLAELTGYTGNTDFKYTLSRR